MKPLIIPIIVGLLAGLGGGSGYSYMRASAKFSADSAHLADSLKNHPADSTSIKSEDRDSAEDSHATPVAGDAAHASADSASATGQGSPDDVSLTPADSIRVLEAARTALRKGQTNTVVHPNAKAPSGAPTASGAVSGTVRADAKAPTVRSDAPPASRADGKPEPKEDPKVSTATAATMVKTARDAALNTPLPEQRLAKIFSAMPAKDAAKVLDQMTDSDIRGILALMGDKQAAAILTAMPPARAAAITKSPTRPTPSTP